MNVFELLQSIDASKAPPPIMLFCPAKAPKAREASFEPFLAEQAIHRLVAAYVDPSLKDLAYTAFYADETPVQEIVLEAQTVPFLAERRVVFVRGAERYATGSGAEIMLDYLDAPCEQTLLILLAATLDKRTRFYKVCEQRGTIIECPQLNDREAGQWATNEARNRGKTLEAAAVRELIRRAGTHLSDINNALNIVNSYVGDATVIREADIHAACADVAEEEVWALTDAIASSQPGAALAALRRLMDLGRQEDELLGTINWLLKSAYSLVLEKAGPPTINAFVAKKVQPLADKLGMKKLRDAFILCTDTHFMIRSTGVDSALALELLVLKLATPIKRAPSAQAE